MPVSVDKMLSQGDSERLLLIKLQRLVPVVHISHVLLAVSAIGLVVLAMDYARMLLLRRKMVHAFQLFKLFNMTDSWSSSRQVLFHGP